LAIREIGGKLLIKVGGKKHEVGGGGGFSMDRPLEDMGRPSAMMEAGLLIKFTESGGERRGIGWFNTSTGKRPARFASPVQCMENSKDGAVMEKSHSGAAADRRINVGRGRKRGNGSGGVVAELDGVGGSNVPERVCREGEANSDDKGVTVESLDAASRAGMLHTRREVEKLEERALGRNCRRRRICEIDTGVEN
jgi:hypothetical protein